MPFRASRLLSYTSDGCCAYFAPLHFSKRGEIHAQDLDELRKSRKIAGPLHGIPISVKETIFLKVCSVQPVLLYFRPGALTCVSACLCVFGRKGGGD